MARTLTAVFVILLLVTVGCAAAPTATLTPVPTRPPATPTAGAAPPAVVAAPTGAATVPAAVVATPTVAAAVTPPAAAVVEVTIEGFAFKPATVKVAPGTTVRWTQKDTAPHTVTSDKGVFDSKNLNQGQTFTFKFDAPGQYNYICAYHPNMKGTLEVQ